MTDDNPEHQETGVFPVTFTTKKTELSVWQTLWVNLIERHTSRKFEVCAFLEIASTYAGMAKIIDQGTWLAFATLILGTYCTASIVDKKQNGGAG